VTNDGDFAEIVQFLRKFIKIREISARVQTLLSTNGHILLKYAASDLSTHPNQKRIIMYHKTLFSVALLVASAAFPAHALKAEQTVEREVVVLNADGSQTVTRIAADKVTPGDKVVYSLNYFNDEAAPAENIVLVMPIPAEVDFIDGSADFNNVSSGFSTDGGKTFANRNDLQAEQSDGTKIAARTSDITHIRWSIRSAVSPNTGGTLSFSGRLQ